MALTDAKIRGLKAESKPRKYSDSGGLHVLVPVSGSKLWKLAYRFQGKQRTLALGAYPEIGLAAARGLAARAKAALAEGRDPAAEDKAVLSGPKSDTFAAVAMEWLTAQERVWDPAHSLRVGGRLRADVLPALGDRPIDQITAPEVLRVVRKVEDRGAIDVAKRARQTIGAIFRYGIATGRCERDPAGDLKGALRPAPRPQHMKMLQVSQLPKMVWLPPFPERHQSANMSGA